MSVYVDPSVAALMKKHGLSPLSDPLGDGHHTDESFSDSDLELAHVAWFLGGLFIDVESRDDADRYFQHEMTSLDQWARVARALRIHGLKIVNASAPEPTP